MTGWAVLAAGALVASLLAVGASPAAALDEDSKPNAEAKTSACVGAAAQDAGFTDVTEGHAFRSAINCLAYYGVTVGYGDGTFQPNADVANEEMVLFMERAAGIAGADADAVVGDFADTGSDPVHRGDMALLIARLLAAATTAESAQNVKNNADGTFTVDGVAAKDWDYFADSRRTQNRVHDSAASALYELGVAKGTGMGHFSPASTVSRGAMAAFITRALAHTTARPEGVTIQSDGPGEVIISVRDANFHPEANAPVDVFSARADQVDEAFKEDGSCGPRVTGVGNPKVCEIDPLDAVTGLSGDYDPGAITVNVKAGGTTVWAWTGESGDKFDSDETSRASINLTEAAPVTADMAKVKTDMAEGVTRAHFGSTVTVTIQLVGDATTNRADAGPTAGNNGYTVTIRRATDTNIESDATPAAVDDTTAGSKTTQVLKVDATGKATFEITASDPDATDRNNPNGDSTVTPVVPNRIDRVRVTYTVAPATTDGGPAVDNDISDTDAGSQTITFSDAKATLTRATVKPATDFRTRPESGSASNVVTVTVVDQYGKPIRGHLVRLSSAHEPAADRESTFPVPRRTDSSGTVRIGYTYTGAGSTETITANTAGAAADGSEDVAIANGRAAFYWVAPAAGPDVASGIVLAADLDNNRIIVVGTDGPLLVNYDSNDQYSVGASGSEELTNMAAFEEALAADGAGGTTRNDTVVVSSYKPTDPGDVARFVLTVAPAA